MTLDDKPNIHANNDEAFRNVCNKNNLEMAKWLMTLDNKPNIHANNDEAFRNVCNKNNLEMAKWLSTLCNNYKLEIINENIMKYDVTYKLEQLYNDKKYYKIIEYLNIQKSDFNLNTDDKCIICFSDSYNFLTSCKHTFCIDCFFTWYIGNNKKECSYCMKFIEIEKCCYNPLIKCELQKKSYIYETILSLFNFSIKF